MPQTALAKIKHDALDLLGRIVTVYERQIAKGEVGAGGTATAGPSRPTEPSTGLLYGRIQSGKTVAMIGLVAAAIDNGFRVIVVLTSDNVKLVTQTTERFGALEGPIAIDALKPGGWSSDHKHIAKHIGQSGVVFVCSKNKKRLDELIAFLVKIDAPNYPALVLDDEADQATLDTNLAKNVRAKEKGKPVGDPTAIYQRVVESLRNTLRHHVFLQVTATPYALLLQSVGTRLRPSFTRLLEPGAEYTGGEFFFEHEHVEGPKPPLEVVPEDESDAMLGASEAPEGLQKAIAFFLVAAGAQAISDPVSAKAGQNFLCHTSQLRIQHRVLEGLVRDYIDRISENLDSDRGPALNRLHIAYGELQKTMPEAPPFEAVIEQIKRRLVGRKVVVVNAEADAETGRGLNFIVGGNILGRGVTIENLLVTYYLRQPKMGQMDTMLQHARMFGYRAKLMHLTRVFLPHQLAVRFHEIHQIEKRLRKHLAYADMGKQIVIEKAANLNPTRRTVLDPTYIDAFEAGEQIFPIYPEFRPKDPEHARLTSAVQRMMGGDLSKNKTHRMIPYEDLYWLIENFPYDKSQPSSSWIPDVLRRVVERQRERVHGRAFLYFRKMDRKTRTFTSGALDGKAELPMLRGLGGPVFCALRDRGVLIPDPGAREYWYPVLVLDSEMPSLIINTTPDA